MTDEVTGTVSYLFGPMEQEARQWQAQQVRVCAGSRLARARGRHRREPGEQKRPVHTDLLQLQASVQVLAPLHTPRAPRAPRQHNSLRGQRTAAVRHATSYAPAGTLCAAPTVTTATGAASTPSVAATAATVATAATGCAEGFWGSIDGPPSSPGRHAALVPYPDSMEICMCRMWVG